MKCFYHIEREAVATCQHCGKGLCHECAAKFNPCYCSDCAKIISVRNSQDRKMYSETVITPQIKEIRDENIGIVICFILGGILAFVSLYLTNRYLSGYDYPNELYKNINIYMLPVLAFCFPCGWRAISSTESSITSLTVLIFPIVLIFKIILSFLIGWALVPFYFIKFIVNIVKINKLKGEKKSLK